MNPLDELRDIHLPNVPGIWPPAIGWWFSIIFASIIVLLIIIWAYNFWRSNRYRRKALLELDQIFAEYGQEGCESQYIISLQHLLKRVALTCYQRSDVASLTGEAWVAFLDQTSRSQEFVMGEGQVLIDGQYSKYPKVDVKALHRCSANWIKQHRKEYHK